MKFILQLMVSIHPSKCIRGYSTIGLLLKQISLCRHRIYKEEWVHLLT